jgi:hypothetical protein
MGILSSAKELLPAQGWDSRLWELRRNPPVPRSAVRDRHKVSAVGGDQVAASRKVAGCAAGKESSLSQRKSRRRRSGLYGLSRYFLRGYCFSYPAASPLSFVAGIIAVSSAHSAEHYSRFVGIKRSLAAGRVHFCTQGLSFNAADAILADGRLKGA